MFEPSLADPPKINRMSFEKNCINDEEEYPLSEKVGALLEFMVVDGWKIDYLSKILRTLPLSDEERIKLKSYAAVCFALVDQMSTVFDDECSDASSTVSLRYADESVDVNIPSTPAASTAPAPLTVTATAVTPPVQPMFTTRRTKVVDGELIMFEEDAFKYKLDDKTLRSTSSNTQLATQSTAVNKIISIIKSPAINKKQQVVALCVASMHSKVCHIFKSAGLVDQEEYKTLKFMGEQMKKLVQKARETKTLYGRPTEDKVAFVETLIMAMVDDLPINGEDQDTAVSKVPTKKKRLELLGIPLSSGYVMFKKQELRRQEIMHDEGDFKIRQKRLGFWQKVSDEIRAKVVKFIRNHQHVINSPTARDTIRVPDPDNPEQWIRRNKLLLQCTVCELMDDLYSNNTLRGVVTNDEGNKLMSETLLRALLPPELIFMSNHYKQMCCCEYCVLMEYYQNALNRYWEARLTEMKKKVNEMQERTINQKRKKPEEKKKVVAYQQQAFCVSPDKSHPLPLHAKPRNAVSYVQCDPPPEFAAEGLSHINCALGRCKNCPKYNRPDLEKEWGVEDKKIYFYHYEIMPTCSRCGLCSRGETECPTCKK